MATHQLALTIWTFLAFALDAIAIAAQALTGRSLGAGDLAGTRAVDPPDGAVGAAVRRGHRPRCSRPSPRCSAGCSPTDPAVRDLLVPVLLVAAVFQPVAGVVFVLDGVLIGAGDGRYLAWGGIVVLAVFAPLALAAVRLGSGDGEPA